MAYLWKSTRDEIESGCRDKKNNDRCGDVLEQQFEAGSNRSHIRRGAGSARFYSKLHRQGSSRVFLLVSRRAASLSAGLLFAHR